MERPIRRRNLKSVEQCLQKLQKSDLSEMPSPDEPRADIPWVFFSTAMCIGEVSCGQSEACRGAQNIPNDCVGPCCACRIFFISFVKDYFNQTFIGGNYVNVSHKTQAQTALSGSVCPVNLFFFKLLEMFRKFDFFGHFSNISTCFRFRLDPFDDNSLASR